MRRFSLYRRGSVYYCRFKNKTTGSWTSGRSTGESDRESATAWAYAVEKYGLPETSRTLREVITLDTILHHIREAETLDAEDAAKIIAALERRGLAVNG